MQKALYFPATSEPLPTESRGEVLVELLRRSGGYAKLTELVAATGWPREIVMGYARAYAPIKAIQMMYVLMEDDGHICATCLTKHGAPA